MTKLRATVLGGVLDALSVQSVPLETWASDQLVDIEDDPVHVGAGQSEDNSNA